MLIHLELVVTRRPRVLRWYSRCAAHGCVDETESSGMGAGHGILVDFAWMCITMA